MTAGVRFVCHGCGAEVDPGAALPLRCPRAGQGDADHLLERVIAAERPVSPLGDDPRPFLRFRQGLTAWRVSAGGDAAYRAMAQELDDAVGEVDGRGFRETPLLVADRLAPRVGLAPGALLVKDETGNVAGSHKARHLFGAMLYLEAVGRGGRAFARGLRRRPLAVASCGNAALAAAVVARAARWPLDVYVPEAASAGVVARLEALGARVTRCPRRSGEAGDPSYLRFREAVARGALPFTCQGNEAAIAIEGGETLGYEVAAAGQVPDRLFVQVGGGALGTAVARGLAALGASRRPRLHAVQTEAAWPLARAYARVAERALAGLASRGIATPPAEDPRARADLLAAHASGEAVRGALAHAARHRSAYMWPWEREPRSIAGGILDDETYDWFALVREMIASGGWPIVVSEATLAEANAVGRAATGIPADPTGTAGLAGLLELQRQAPLDAGERALVIFSGVDRTAAG